MKISASIIVLNEAKNIRELCETVAWADEIIIVDTDSTDGTAAIAAEYTDKVLNREFFGFKDKHEFADAHTTGDWIFWIDADERVTPELQQSILALKERSDLPDGFKIARRTWYMGRWIKHGGWYPDYQMRLYRKDKSYWDGIAPHQTARVDGRVETLKGELLHYTKDDLAEHHRVTGLYARLAADHMAENRKTSGPGKIFWRPVAAFVRTYILKQGFRDGTQGLIIAMFTAYGVFLRYAKIWEKDVPKESNGVDAAHDSTI
ncbi:MAG: glycosyltransferase family 2 protein [Blastocatellia bacterium]|nr:glycosyltransferase family 2 protein [Blastocatellia bacterium]